MPLNNHKNNKLYKCDSGDFNIIIRTKYTLANLEQFKRRNIIYKFKVRVTVLKVNRIICENNHESTIDNNLLIRFDKLFILFLNQVV